MARIKTVRGQLNKPTTSCPGAATTLFVAAVALAACQDHGPTLPRRATAAPDASAAPTARVYVLHIGHHKTATFAFVGTTVDIDGHGARDQGSHAAELEALIAKYAAADRQAEAIIAQYSRAWKRLKLPDVEDGDGGKGQRILHPNAPSSSRLSPGDRASFLCTTDSATGTLTGDCTPDTGGSTDPCTALYLQLYNDTQQLHQDQQLLAIMEYDDSFYGCHPTGTNLPPDGPYAVICTSILENELTYQHWINMDYVYLNGDVYDLSLMGCNPNNPY